MNGVVYYGAINDEGTLDTEQAFLSKPAFHHGYTFCRNDYFGYDPLPGTKKYCFCDYVAAKGETMYDQCATEGTNCQCDIGGSIIIGQPNGP
jgi:hypothetical protein